MPPPRFPPPEELARLIGNRTRRLLSPDGLLPAAVLVPLHWTGNDYDVLLTKRTEDVETHKGQVAFPGGMCEPGDADARTTALREAEEELGMTRTEVSIAGCLDDVTIPSGFLVTPVVGLLRRRPACTPNPLEVSDVFYAPLSFFSAGENARREERLVHDRVHEVWYYTTGGHTVWGATAGIIRSLLALLDATSPRTRPPRA
jgi:8-oxo-dGTP pyrophosphatase MutT (NUDIX family)